MSIRTVHFFADPCCPWTWNTSRWLVEAAEMAGVDIVWRTLCLAELNKDREVSEHFRPKLTCSRRMARLLEALRAEGRNDEMQAMCDLEELQWHMDFEDWLQANNRYPSGEDNHG
jgi:predicted DsbA family dithiol-disulfide isomerase